MHTIIIGNSISIEIWSNGDHTIGCCHSSIVSIVKDLVGEVIVWYAIGCKARGEVIVWYTIGCEAQINLHGQYCHRMIVVG